MAHEVTFDPPIEGGVVVGYDGSAASRRALAVAADEAQRHGWPLHVVRAWVLTTAMADVGAPYGSVPSLEECATVIRDSVEQTAAQLRQQHAGLEVVPHVHHGGAVDALLAASEKADVVVVARRGRGGFVDLLLGSTAEQVIRHARSSVLVVRPG